MSKLARAEFNNARIQQTTQNDARRIRQRVEAAQQGPARAGIRWPFELMQNAHDAGARDGDERVEIDFVLSGDQLKVSHTGKPFVTQELAALLSGGSSKEFDSEETTGRFGTGFLVTHALSTRVDVDGVLTTQEGSETFHIELRRDGDEKSIVENIDLANQSLENAKAVPDAWVANNSTASFTYYNPDDSVVQWGLDRLEEALPYLYATCGIIGRVRIERPGERICFEPSGLCKHDRDAFVINNIDISITTDDDHTCVTAVRASRERGRSALLVVLESDEADTQRIRLPSKGFARIFVTFPIAGTDVLPFNVVLDGNFAPLQERDGIAMHADDRVLIDEALSAFPALVQHAVESDWGDAHQLASLDVPNRALSGENENGELDWWQGLILKISKETAAMPIVQTESGLLPALHEQERLAVSFLVPAIDADATECVDYDTAHEVADAIVGLTLSSKAVAQSWGKVAHKWAKIGVPVKRLGLRELTVWLKDRADSVYDVPVHGDRFTWVARLFLLASDMKDQNVREMVNGLLPDQYGKFHSTETDYLYKDGEISKEVKDIAYEVGKDIRSQLLHSDMAKALEASGFEDANSLVSDLLDKKDSSEYTESKAIDMVLDCLSERLPHDSEFDDDTGLFALRASARLIVYLSDSHNETRIRRCPLLTANGNVAHLSGSQQILAPKLSWPGPARPYAGLYTERRLLSDRYCDDDYLAQALGKLIAMGLVIAAPLFEGRRAEIEDANLLREMSCGEHDIAGVTVRGASFGQIAFLSTDLVNRCAQDPELAKLLLDFVLNVAAREDQSWHETKTVVGSRSGERVILSLYGATWPFELKVRSWIPVERPDEEGIIPMPASESNLRDILDISWLRNNRDAQELLHHIFGFQQLSLALDTLDEDTKKDLAGLLQDPELVRAAAANPDTVKFASELESVGIELGTVREVVRDMESDEGLADLIAERRKQVQVVRDNHHLGNQVEELVKANLQEAGFCVQRTGIGSDFKISAEVGHVANLELVLGSQSWLVEIKATREQQSVRMTDTQAKNSVSQGRRFLLCVVPVESESDYLKTDEVRANIRFVPDIGARLSALCSDLGEFEGLRENITSDESTGVQLEIVLGTTRVRIARSVWENDGFPLDELAGRLSSQ